MSDLRPECEGHHNIRGFLRSFKALKRLITKVKIAPHCAAHPVGVPSSMSFRANDKAVRTGLFFAKFDCGCGLCLPASVICRCAAASRISIAKMQQAQAVRAANSQIIFDMEKIEIRRRREA
jgi:hypothetical protein